MYFLDGIIGSFSIHEGDSNENMTSKMSVFLTFSRLFSFAENHVE